MIKRMQSNGLGGTPKTYASTFDCIRQILAKEGVGGFYKGIGVNIVKVCGPRHPAPLRAWRLLEPPSPGTAGHPERHDPVHRL
jgi:hypothetical protein